jgi:hypothetical protein
VGSEDQGGAGSYKVGRSIPATHSFLEGIKANNEIKIIGDGACPPSLAGDLLPAKFAEHGIETEGEAGGMSVDRKLDESPYFSVRFFPT